MGKPCALAGCPNSLSAPTYKLYQSTDEYCSRNCVQDAYLIRYGKKNETSHPCADPNCGRPVRIDSAVRTKDGRCYHQQCEAPMDVPVKAFGGVEITRSICDNPACRQPINLSWKRNGKEFCSNACSKVKISKEDTSMTASNEVVDATAATPAASPISGGKTATAAPKKAAKKAAPPAKAKGKAAPAAKTPKAAKSAEPKASPTIKLVKGFDPAAYRMESGERAKFLADSPRTVAEFVAHCKKKDPSRDGRGFLAGLVKAGQATLVAAK